MLAALDRINNYEEVLRGFKEKNLQTASSISSMQNLATAAETDAAVAIQSAFKGYKVRKEIKEIQTFYQQVFTKKTNKDLKKTKIDLKLLFPKGFRL